MSLRRGIVLVVVVALDWMVPGAQAQEVVEAAGGYERIATLLRPEIQRGIEEGAFPALSIALVDDQRIVWAEGFGMADPVAGKPATAETIYRVGSVSKLFTALAAMQLVEQGRLDLDVPVSDYLPDFAPRNRFGKAITLRQLMAHRSGLVRESPVGNYFDASSPTTAATVASLNETDLVYEPGTRIKYSNAAVSVVGRIVEIVSGQPFEDYVREHMLRPMGMARADFVRTPEVEADLAKAEMWTYDDRVFEAPGFALGTLPAGNLYASVVDLGRFLSVLFAEGRAAAGPIIGAGTLRAMYEPQFARPGTLSGYGLGFALGTLMPGQGDRPRRRIGHGGAVYGFSTEVAALPEEKLGVVIVASRDCSNGWLRTLAELSLRAAVEVKEAQGDRVLEGPRQEQPRASLEELRRWEGRYVSGEKGLEVWLQHGKLYALELQGGVRRQIQAGASGRGVLVPAIDEGLLFGSTGMLTLQDGNQTLAAGDLMLRRVETPVPPPPKDSWKGLIGEYGPDHNILYILERDGRLHALIEWLFLYPLEELGDDCFAFPDWGMYHGEKLLFERDSTGRGTGVVAASVRFSRREIPGEDGKTFQVRPVRPVEELRPAALAASPPVEPGEFRPPDLVELTALDPSIRLDIRYATTNNFLGSVMYTEARAFLQRPAAEALVRVHRKLESQGLGLLIHDAYRPWSVTRLFWDATPEASRGFVAHPERGSKHNRGCAVDLTLYDRTTGEPMTMVAGYDEFSDRSSAFYSGGTSRQRWYRDLLRRAMEAEGFAVIPNEWWHFDFKDWPAYGLQNLRFEEITATRPPGQEETDRP